MLRLLILASACVLALCQTPQLNIWRKDIRTPEAMAIIQRLHQQQQQDQLQYHQEPQPQQPQQQQQTQLQQEQQQQYEAPQYQSNSPSQVNQYTPQAPRPAAAAAPAPPAAPVAVGYGDAYVDLAASNAIARNILHFAQSVGNELALQYSKTSVFSPLSIVSALALLMLGSKGHSYRELASVFGLNDAITMHEQFGLMLRDVQQPTKEAMSPQRQIEMDPWRQPSNNVNQRPNKRYQRAGPHEVYLANGLFTQQGYTLNADYRQVVTGIYNSELKPQDFESSPAKARYNINYWVETKTKHKIIDVIAADIPPSTRMILANALYFKAFWETEFIPSATKPDNFYPNGEASQDILRVPMMATGGNFPYHEDPELNCKIIGLPFRGNLSTMYIIQPLQSSIVQLKYLQQKLTADKIEGLISKMYRRSTLLALPKFHIVESVNMKSVLQRIGLGSMFGISQNDFSLIAENPTTAAPNSSGRSSTSSARPRQNLSNTSDSLRNLEAQRGAAPAPTSGPKSDLHVDEIIHKVDFTVNEQGTEAAAATIAYLKKSGPDILFRVDSPFMFLVRHDPTKLILFYGLINEPPTVA
ncbi:serine protease inhibitor 28Dc [Drosophila tropicalis]|uniref:serine protease inhibitor 28Dc n=1 Tax=Drosophila tropicalis TaxID=46794 RepID=UPI0035ABBE2F